MFTVDFFEESWAVSTVILVTPFKGISVAKSIRALTLFQSGHPFAFISKIDLSTLVNSNQKKNLLSTVLFVNVNAFALSFALMPLSFINISISISVLALAVLQIVLISKIEFSTLVNSNQKKTLTVPHIWPPSPNNKKSFKIEAPL